MRPDIGAIVWQSTLPAPYRQIRWAMWVCDNDPNYFLQGCDVWFLRNADNPRFRALQARRGFNPLLENAVGPGNQRLSNQRLDM